MDLGGRDITLNPFGFSRTPPIYSHITRKKLDSGSPMGRLDVYGGEQAFAAPRLFKNTLKRMDKKEKIMKSYVERVLNDLK